MLGNFDNVLSQTYSILSRVEPTNTTSEVKTATSDLKKSNDALKDFAQSTLDKSQVEMAEKIQVRIQHLQNLAKNPSTALQQQVTAVFYKELRTTRDRIKKILERFSKQKKSVESTYKPKTR
jgi:hypothetical protein